MKTDNNNQEQLIDFIHTAKAPLGIFRIKTADDNFRIEHYSVCAVFQELVR